MWGRPHVSEGLEEAHLYFLNIYLKIINNSISSGCDFLHHKQYFYGKNNHLFAGCPYSELLFELAAKLLQPWVVQVACGRGWGVDLMLSSGQSPRSLRSSVISTVLRDAEEYFSFVKVWSQRSLTQMWRCSTLVDISSRRLRSPPLLCVF